MGGGTRSNVVPEKAWARVDVRVPNAEEAARIQARMESLEPHSADGLVEVSGGVNRPPMVRTPEIVALYRRAEALAAGLPVLGEPRDGTAERIVHGDTGFYCVDFDAYLYALKLLKRKEQYRREMGRNAKEWAAENLDPRRWADVVAEAVA